MGGGFGFCPWMKSNRFGTWGRGRIRLLFLLKANSSLKQLKIYYCRSMIFISFCVSLSIYSEYYVQSSTIGQISSIQTHWS